MYIYLCISYPCTTYIFGYLGVDEFYFAHGHPNVTSGGLLGFIAAYSTLLQLPAGDVFEFTG